LSRAEARARVAADGVHGGTFTPHCAAVDPARLVRGLADAVERLGVVVHEGTSVTGLEPHRVRSPDGEVRARVVVRALEGYTPSLRGHRRAVVPVHSLVLATEPLPEAAWDEIGWRGRETLGDARRLVVYAQRTRDGRVVFGGRGAPYRVGSRTSRRRSTPAVSTTPCGGASSSCSRRWPTSASATAGAGCSACPGTGGPR